MFIDINNRLNLLNKRINEGGIIILPSCLYEITESLLDEDREVSGQLICKVIDSNTYLIEYISVLSYGENSNVKLDKKIELPKNSKYKLIDFHTHIGELNQDSFSTNDLRTFRSIKEKEYIHVLFTFSHILVYCNNTKCSIEVIENKDEDVVIIENNYSKWKNHLCQ